jgi:uncharacterized protein with beta-barrel porin domain
LGFSGGCPSARHNFGPAYVAAALGCGRHDVTTNRAVALAGIDLLQGRFSADTFSGRFEGGYPPTLLFDRRA